MLRGERASGGAWVKPSAFIVLFLGLLCVVVRAKAERGQSEADERVCHPIPSAHVASGYSARPIACSRRWALSSCGASWTSLPSGCMHGWLQRVAQTPPPGFGGYLPAGGLDPCWSLCSWAFPAGWLEHSHAGCLSLPLRLPSVSPTRHHVTAQQRQRELHVGRARSISRDKARCA